MLRLDPDHQCPLGTDYFEAHLRLKWHAYGNALVLDEILPAFIPFANTHVQVRLAAEDRFAKIMLLESAPRPYLYADFGHRTRPLVFTDAIAKVKYPGGANSHPFQPSKRYLEVVAWYHLTLHLPRPLKGFNNGTDMRDSGLHD